MKKPVVENFDTLSPMEVIAKSAIDFVKQFNLHGDTQASTNNLFDNGLLHKLKYISLGIDSLRYQCSIETIGNVYAFQAKLYSLINSKLILLTTKATLVFIQEYTKLANFESVINQSVKFNLGNCFEHAFLLLNYMLNNHPTIPAEVYKIKGGDHVFLVIGQWGKDAVICDSWAGCFYPAQEYRAKLKNFYFDEITKRPLLELFDPERHSIQPLKNFNTRFLLRVREQTFIVLHLDLKCKAKPLFNTLTLCRVLVSFTKALYVNIDEYKKLILDKKIKQIEELHNRYSTIINEMDYLGMQPNHFIQAFSNELRKTLFFSPQKMIILKNIGFIQLRSNTEDQAFFKHIECIHAQISLDMKLWPQNRVLCISPDTEAYIFIDILFNEIPVTQQLDFAMNNIHNVIIRDVEVFRAIIQALSSPKYQMQLFFYCKNKVKSHIWTEYIQIRMQECIKNDNYPTVDEYLKAGGDPNLLLKEGVTLLKYAFDIASLNIVTLLSNNNALLELMPAQSKSSNFFERKETFRSILDQDTTIKYGPN